MIRPLGSANSRAESIAGVGGYPRYPAYKESGIEWLGDFPSHWEILQIGRLGTLRKCNGGTKADELIEGVPCVRYGDLYTHHAGFIRTSRSCVSADRAPDYTQIQYGDVLFAASGETIDEIGKSAVSLMETDACCGGDVILLRTSLDVDATFMGYATDSPQATFQKGRMGRGITVMHIYSDQIKYLSLAVPPVTEQRVISVFLDRETAKIDALVAKKERLIELLQEKRTALITRAVTKGLDPDVPMKDSGVEWLGEIPVHWEVSQLNRVVRRFVDYRGKTPEKAFSGVPLITARNIKNQMIDFSESREYIREELYLDWMVRGLPDAGDVVVTTEAPLGESAQICDTSAALAQRIILLKVVGQKLVNEYLKYHFVGDLGRSELHTRATGSTAIGIKASHFRASLITTPPIVEQVQISQHLDRETAKIDALMAKIREAIERLKELRMALISAAVTGKIDVRGAAG